MIERQTVCRRCGDSGCERQRGKTRRPVVRCRAGEPQRDQSETEGQRGLPQPHRNPVGDYVAASALGEHEFDAGETQQRADDDRHDPGEEARQQRAASFE